jgi:hypothetical protein
VPAVVAEALLDLDGKLPGGSQDQRAGRLGLTGTPRFGQTLEDGKGEGGRLAGAGLGDAQQVTAFEQERNGLLLDRSGRFVAFLLQCLE